MRVGAGGVDGYQRGDGYGGGHKEPSGVTIKAEPKEDEVADVAAASVAVW